MGDTSPSSGLKETRPCLSCGKAALQVCSGCLLVAFCGIPCQRASWKSHKAVCVPQIGGALVAVSSPPGGAASSKVPTLSRAMSTAHLVATMRAHIRSAKVALDGVGLLMLKARPDGPGTFSASGARELVAAGAAPVIVDVLRVHAAENLTCGIAIGGVLRSLLELGDAGRVAVVSAGAFPQLVAVLSIHVSHAGLCATVCETLFKLLIDAYGELPDAVAASAATPLIAALRAHPRDDDVLRYASGGLTGLARTAAGADAAFSAGALDQLVACARSVSAATPKVAGALGVLVVEFGTTSDRKEAAVRAGAMAELVAGLKAHPRDPGLSFYAIRAIACLVTVDAGRAAAVAAGAAATVVAALRAHATDANVCLHAIAALGKVALCREGLAAGIAAGAVLQLMATMRRHVRFDGVFVNTCFALGAFVDSADDGSVAATAMAAGALPLIVAALKLHSARPHPCRAACFLLGHLAKSAEAKAACASTGAVALVVDALRLHGASDVDLRRNATKVLAEMMSDHDENTAAAALAGAIPILVSLLRDQPRDVDVVTDVCVALLAFTVYGADVEAQMSALNASGVVPLAVAFLAHVRRVPPGAADAKEIEEFAKRMAHSLLDAMGFSDEGVPL